MAKSEAVEVATTIGKVDLVRLACKKTQQRLSHDVVSDAYSAVCDALVDCLMNGNTVTLQGVGRLIPIIRPGGEGRNPGTGESITYEDRLGVKFQVNTNLKLAMRDVDIKSLGTGAAGKHTDQAGQANATGRGGRSAGRSEAVAGKVGGAAPDKQAASTRAARRR